MFIYIDELLDALLRCVDKPLNQVLNLAGSEEISVFRLAIKCCRLTNNFPPIQHIDDRAGQIFRERLSVEKAKKVLGWHPKWNLDRGLEATYQWICQQ